MTIKPEDAALVDRAKALIRKYYVAGQHHVGFSLRSGEEIFDSLHLDSHGMDICAEPIALSNAIIFGCRRFDAGVAAMWDGDPNSEPWVVPPCGDCRQLLLQYAPSMRVILDDHGLLRTFAPSFLLPFAYGGPAQKKSRKHGNSERRRHVK